MKSNVAFLLFVLVLPNIKGDTNVPEYITWIKNELSLWHQYFPSRALQEGFLTIDWAVKAAESMDDGLYSSLEKVVQYQAQELMSAELMMEDTSAQGCIRGISNYMEKAIDQAVNNYSDCAADMLPRLVRLSKSWSKANITYQYVYQRTLAGIDSCAKTYPNKDSINRLRICVESWIKNYYAAANATTLNVFASPAMVVFSTTAAACAESAANEVVVKGWTFLNMLVQCAKLSENVDAEMYKEQVLSSFLSYQTRNDLRFQIFQAQNINKQQVSQVEQQMLFYHDLQKSAMEKYLIESRGQSYYSSLLSGYLSEFYYAVSQAGSDNPASVECSSTATGALDEVLDTASSAAQQCDEDIVNDAKRRIVEVNEDFQNINKFLPSIGNAAVLSCFTDGYVFAQNTILDCFKLTSDNFSVSLNEIYRSSIDVDVRKLAEYESTFFSSKNLPCGDTILSKAYLAANKVLYDLQRCLYTTSGARYDVTVSPTLPPWTETSTVMTTPTETSYSTRGLTYGPTSTEWHY